MATSKGEVYGFVTKEGDVYIDPNKLNANTPIHEVGHLFWDIMPEKEKQEIIDLLKETPMWQELAPPSPPRRGGCEGARCIFISQNRCTNSRRNIQYDTRQQRRGKIYVRVVGR